MAYLAPHDVLYELQAFSMTGTVTSVPPLPLDVVHGTAAFDFRV